MLILLFQKKAEESHTILDKLMPPTEEPSVLVSSCCLFSSTSTYFGILHVEKELKKKTWLYLRKEMRIHPMKTFETYLTCFLLQPLYHQPTDTEVYMENKRQYAGFKRRLMEYFKKRHADKNSRDAHLTQTYSKLMTEWLKKVEKVSSRSGL